MYPCTAPRRSPCAAPVLGARARTYVTYTYSICTCTWCGERGMWNTACAPEVGRPAVYVPRRCAAYRSAQYNKCFRCIMCAISAPRKRRSAKRKRHCFPALYCIWPITTNEPTHTHALDEVWGMANKVQ